MDSVVGDDKEYRSQLETMATRNLEKLNQARQFPPNIEDINIYEKRMNIALESIFETMVEFNETS